MRSKAIEILDYRTVPISAPLYIRGVDTQVQTELHRLLNPYKELVQVDTVQPGDAVTLDLESGLAKFNRKGLSILVGKNLFDRELEAQLMGKGKEIFGIAVQNTPVQVEIKSISRQVYPELTDELVRTKLGGTDAGSFLSRLRKDVIARKQEEAINQEVQRLLDAVISGSTWALDEEEIAHYVAEYLSHSEAQLASQGLSWETMTGRDYRSFFGPIGSKEELEAYLQKEVQTALARKLLSCHLSLLDARKLSAGEVQESVWTVLEAYIRANATFKEECP